MEPSGEKRKIVLPLQATSFSGREASDQHKGRQRKRWRVRRAQQDLGACSLFKDQETAERSRYAELLRVTAE